MSGCTRLLIAAASLALMVFGLAGSARASGYPGISFGGELGSVVSANPTAIYYNPGGLGFSGSQLMLDVALAMRSVEWTHAPGQGDIPEPAGFEGANYGTASAMLIAGGPQFGASFQLGKHVVIGGGWFVPWGGGSFTWDRNERFANSMYPGTADGVARWHGYEAGMRFIYTTAGGALRFGPLSIGATGNFIISSFALKRSQNPMGNNDITREQRVSLEVNEFVGSFGLGAMLEAIPERLWFGASYQAQPGLGELTLDGKYTYDPTIGVMDATRTQDVTMHQALPDITRAGVRYRPLQTFEVRLTGNFTRWGLNQTQCVSLKDKPCLVNPDGTAAVGSGVIKNMRRNWHNTIGVHAGLSYWPTPAFEIFGGFGYEPAASPSTTLDPLAGDANNMTMALGARLRVFETWFVALSYNHQQFLPRDNTGKSQLADPAVGATSRGIDGGGLYQSWFATANLNIAKTL
jgi:long-chain fatty acid transport protein